jgi:hypothetical protein
VPAIFSLQITQNEMIPSPKNEDAKVKNCCVLAGMYSYGFHSSLCCYL